MASRARSLGDHGESGASGDHGESGASGGHGESGASGGHGGSGASDGHGGSGASGGHGESGDSDGHGGSGICPPPKKIIFLGGSPAGEYPVRASGAEGELDGTNGDEGELAGPAETKASWTRPTLGGARKALILWGAGEEQALGGARVELNWMEAVRRKVS